MTRGALPPPREADPADVWPVLDRAVRVLLPAYLESLGFTAQAAELRALDPVVDAAAADGLRAVGRDLRSAIFERNLELAQHASELASRAESDELDVLKARRAVHDSRFDRASTMVGLILDVCGGWARSTALGPGPWLPPRQAAAVALNELAFVERSIAKVCAPDPLTRLTETWQRPRE